MLRDTGVMNFAVIVDLSASLDVHVHRITSDRAGTPIAVLEQATGGSMNRLGLVSIAVGVSAAAAPMDARCQSFPTSRPAALPSLGPRASTKRAQPRRVWRVGTAGKKYGPFSTTRILHFLEEGRIHGETLLWRAGMSVWRPLYSVSAFAKIVRWRVKSARGKLHGPILADKLRALIALGDVDPSTATAWPDGSRRRLLLGSLPPFSRVKRIDDATGPKSPGLAVGLAIGSTLVPLGLGIALGFGLSDARGPEVGWTALGVALAGVSFGPSVGHFYAGELKRAILMSTARLLLFGAGAPLVGGALVASAFGGGGVLVAAGVAGGSVLVVSGFGLLVWDLVDSNFAARRANRKALQSKPSLGWLPIVSPRGFGIVGRF